MLLSLFETSFFSLTMFLFSLFISFSINAFVSASAPSVSRTNLDILSPEFSICCLISSGINICSNLLLSLRLLILPNEPIVPPIADPTIPASNNLYFSLDQSIPDTPFGFNIAASYTKLVNSVKNSDAPSPTSGLPNFSNIVLVPPFIKASAASLFPCFAIKPACFIKPLVANSNPTSITDVPIALASNLELACVGSLSNSSKYLSPVKLVP